MTDITLLTVNWNQQPCMELLLKSYVKYHYDGTPLKLCLVDNGSKDFSKGFLIENNIPFYDLHNNLGHENALNFVYTTINTRYALLNDTDVEYHDNVYDYIQEIEAIPNCASAGELIDRNVMNGIKIQDRISPWFWIFDIQLMKALGIEEFRDPRNENWTYDVGSWHWEKMQENGIVNLNIPRKHWRQDTEIVSMPYDKFDHIGKVSWDLKKHTDRYSEVMRRRDYVRDRLELYKDIDLKGKFCL